MQERGSRGLVWLLAAGGLSLLSLHGCKDTLKVVGLPGSDVAEASDSGVRFGPGDAGGAGNDTGSGSDTEPEDRAANPDLAGKDSGPTPDVAVPDSAGPDALAVEVLPEIAHEVDHLCTPGLKVCQGTQAQECAADGMSWAVQDCGDKPCFNGGCVECLPGARTCDGEAVLECSADGSGFSQVSTCDFANSGTVCAKGQCVSPCGASESATSTGPTNVGCEYWAVDMDQSQEFGGMDAQYAIVVSNTNDKLTATVEVSNVDGVVKKVEAAPNTATIIQLPPFNVVRVLKQKLAWRVTSNVPIVAYQFNPLENVGVYSNDASLLLPTYSLGMKYLVMAWPHRNWDGSPENPLASNFAVLGTAAGGTTVTLRPACNTAPGPDVPGIGAGGEWTTTLAQYEVLNIESEGPFLDLTGSVVESDKPVAVFGGHVCANSPPSTCSGGKCLYDPDYGGGCGSHADCPITHACDHMEEQLQPVQAWGKHYVVGKTWQRGKAPDFVRILASEADTHVTLSPAVASVPVLGAGQVFSFEAMQDIEVTSDKPVLVGQYLEGEDAPGNQHSFCEEGLFFVKTCDGALFGQSCDSDEECSPNDANVGDPAFMVGVPVEQYRTEYVFLVPTKYQSNYVTVTAPTGVDVTLDGAAAQLSFQPLPSGQFQVARLPLGAGSHILSASMPVGIQVYGWDTYVSYGYPGGMNVGQLQ